MVITYLTRRYVVVELQSYTLAVIRNVYWQVLERICSTINTVNIFLIISIFSGITEIRTSISPMVQ